MTYCYGLASIVLHRLLFVMRRALTSSPQKLLGQSLPNLVCSFIRGSRPKIINFMTPGAGVLVLGRGHISHIVKIHYFFKIFFFTPRHRSDKLSI